MAKGKKQTPRPKVPPKTKVYRHPEASSLLRPEVGTQSQFKKKKPPKEYKYDSSLSPAMEWDGKNPAREQGEAFLREILDAKKLDEAKSAAAKLKAMSKPFLNWAGKAERLSFDVPTLPLFVHERLSTKAIIETLKGHKRDKQIDMFDLFGDPQRSVTDQVLKAYEYSDEWVNRMILGDSLVAMNSLLHYEGLGGQVQMIYIDPPYGVKFGSNFQPFVRKRDVSHNDDDDMTREPEMVKAYRDTWELGLHSYLTYMRDRLLLARDLLHPSGSVFVQISDENVHHVREVMDEVFGEENFCVVICYKRLGIMIGSELKSSAHYLLWYAKEKERQKFKKVFEEQVLGIGSGDHFTQVEHRETGDIRPMTREERINPNLIGKEWKPYQLVSLQTYGLGSSNKFPISLNGHDYRPGPNKAWRTTEDGIQALIKANRIEEAGNTIRFKQFLGDYPFTEVGSIWTNTGRDPDNLYVVQTPTNIVERCMLMTTEPGDLVLDPTCGSGTSAYVAEQWGRRWITVDTSRVPLALARQRLLTATFPYYQLKDESRGPVSGFEYKRKQNNKSEEVGGIVPHVTLKSIANNEPPAEEVLVDRPEEIGKVTRVTGPFCFEATIPTPVDWEGDGEEDSDGQESYGSFVQRMIEVLRRSPVLHLDGGKTIQFKNVRPPAKTLSLSAEAVVDATAPGQKATLTEAVAEADEKNRGMLRLSQKYVALVFGPENGAVSEKLVWEAAKEATAKSYSHLYAIGFSIQANARQLIEKCDETVGIAATYVQATPDLMMGDLLKNMRSSQIFSVCGLPEIKVKRQKAKGKDEADMYQVELLGLEVFDPISMEVEHRNGNDVPAWFLDTDYNGLVFHVSQAFFPRTSAWDNLKKALKATYEEAVWDHLAGTTSAPFEAGEHGQIAVKVVDDRGNELLVVKNLNEVGKW